MRRATILLSVLLLALAMAAAPAQATIHEIVGSHCSANHNAQLDPPGQTPTGFDFDQSGLRALLATGAYDEDSVQVTLNPGDLPTVTIVPADIDHPASKFTWDGESFVGPFPADLDGDGEPDAFLVLPALVPDHPSLERCANLAGHD